MAKPRNKKNRGRRAPSERTPRPPKKPSVADRLASHKHRLPPAGPGVRGKATSSELMITSKIERVHMGEATPAPLPPSPADEAADVWFDQVPTNPAAIPDLDALAPGTRTSKTPIPATAPIRRMPPGEAGYGYDVRGTRSVAMPRPPWVLPALIAAICLVVGILLGALLFGGSRGGGDCKEKQPASGKTPGSPDQPAPKPDSP